MTSVICFKTLRQKRKKGDRRNNNGKMLTATEPGWGFVTLSTWMTEISKIEKLRKKQCNNRKTETKKLGLGRHDCTQARIHLSLPHFRQLLEGFPRAQRVRGWPSLPLSRFKNSSKVRMAATAEAVSGSSFIWDLKYSINSGEREKVIHQIHLSGCKARELCQ